MKHEFRPMHKYQGGWVGVAIGVAASVGGGVLGNRAAKKAAKEAARLEGIVTRHKMGQINRDEQMMRGSTIGNAAGSGVVANKGSVLSVLAEQKNQFYREKKVTREAGATKAAAIKASGAAVGKQALYGGVAQGISLIGQAIDS